MNDDKRPENHQNQDKELSGAEWWRQHLYGDQKEKETEDPGQMYWNGVTDYGRRRMGDPNYGPIPEEYESNRMSRSAFICGILSLVCIFLSAIFVGGSFVLGALGILFALLSKKNKLSRQARAAIIMCSVGMASFLIILAISVGVLVSTGTWDFMMQKIGEIDASDPNSVVEVQQELMDELLKRMGISREEASEVLSEYGLADGRVSSADSDAAAGGSGISSNDGSSGDANGQNGTPASGDPGVQNGNSAPEDAASPGAALLESGKEATVL